MINVWKRIKGLNGVELKTLSEGNPFKIVSVDSSMLEVIPYAGKKDVRPIKKVVFEKAFDILKKNGTIDLEEIRTIIEFSPVYVMAILETFPEVQKAKRGRKTVLEYDHEKERLWNNNVYPDDINAEYELFEGAKKKVIVNSYERNKKARAECIAYHGDKCTVCGMSFLDVYGEHGRGFIHVHHIVELSDIARQYKVDPINDLVPICPNCHAMIHHGNTQMDINELKMTIEKLKHHYK